MLIHKKLSGTVVNIGSDVEIPIYDLAKLIAKMTECQSSLVTSEARNDDPERRSADISLAKSILNWEPRVSLEEGLLRTVEWLRSKTR